MNGNERSPWAPASREANETDRRSLEAPRTVLPSPRPPRAAVARTRHGGAGAGRAAPAAAPGPPGAEAVPAAGAGPGTVACGHGAGGGGGARGCTGPEPGRHANDLLRTRVKLFENQYRKMQPSSSPGFPQHGSPPELIPILTRGRSRSRLYSGSLAHFAVLTVEQKCELAERELLDVKCDIQKVEEDSEKTLHDLEAVIQEADVWWADIKKVVSDFEDDIVRTISNKKGSITASEKLLRYLEEKNHQRKKQTGEMLHEVHAELLQVKKAQYEEEIDEKNQELQQLKLALEKIQVLNFWKKKLQNALETSTVLQKDISQRKEMLEKIERSTTLVKEQQAKEESLIERLQKQLSDYSTPPVMSYVQMRMAIADLEKSIKAWERRVAIAEMTLQSHHRAWNQVKMSGNPHLGCVMHQGKQWKLQREPALWGNALSNGGTSRFHPSSEESQDSA
ncbi:coiled-coil domain-containing protein 113 isoform X2 [Numida meleagris]|uniref:coiled-coil domain-containing protein 113 isoform X2 n=1 Tax=Numida meleagris TaxID=8996 RepID=UPI000B3D8C9A|nr:coiled-coil domain-containing protein 113 isoform X2 [Numida meleagris]